MPGSAPLHFKLVYEYPTGKILGAQAITLIYHIDGYHRILN